MYDQLAYSTGYSDLNGTLPALYVKAAGLAIALLVGTRKPWSDEVARDRCWRAGWVLSATLPGFIQSIKVEPNVRN